MEIKKKIKALPGIHHALKRRYDYHFNHEKHRNLFRGLYDNFDEARRNIPQTKPVGYDNPASPQMYRNVISSIRPHDYPVLYWLKEILPSANSVIDYGGHVGILFYGLSRYIEFPTDFRWNIYDVASVLVEGWNLAQYAAENRLHFHSDLAQISEGDVFLASGSLQYFEENLSDILKKLGQRPRHIIINMTPLHENRQFVTVNNMGVAYCPYKVAHKDSFIRDLENNGWVIRDSWRNPGKDCEIPFHPESDGIKYYGFYLN